MRSELGWGTWFCTSPRQTREFCHKGRGSTISQRPSYHSRACKVSFKLLGIQYFVGTHVKCQKDDKLHQALLTRCRKIRMVTRSWFRFLLWPCSGGWVLGKDSTKAHSKVGIGPSKLPSGGTIRLQDDPATCFGLLSLDCDVISNVLCLPKPSCLSGEAR